MQIKIIRAKIITEIIIITETILHISLDFRLAKIIRLCGPVMGLISLTAQ